MLVQGLVRRVRGGSRAHAERDEPLVGSSERIVACPTCARPLVDGQGRCPGCGTRFIAGVRLRAAAVFVLVGCAVGMIGGALVAGAAMAPRLAAGDAAIAASRGTGQPGGVNGVAPGGEIWLPPVVTRSLLQVAAVNDRLAAYAAELEAALAGRGRRPAEVATLLRRIMADARLGGDAARRVGSWESAAGLAARALTFYASLTETASDGLAAPLADRSAYAAAGRAMQRSLRDLPGVTAATEEVARLAGVGLPGAAAAP